MALYLNYVNEKLIHERTSRRTGKPFYTLSLRSAKSESGWASIFVRKENIIQSTTKEGDAVEGYKNVKLGEPQQAISVSILKGGKYVSIVTTVEKVKKIYDDERQAYRDAHAESIEEEPF